MYADDTTIRASTVSTAELYAEVNNDLTRVRDWLLANKLSLNVTKTEYIFLTTTIKLSNLGRDFPIKIGNNHVNGFLVSKETVVLRRWGRSKQKFRSCSFALFICSDEGLTLETSAF